MISTIPFVLVSLFLAWVVIVLWRYGQDRRSLRRTRARFWAHRCPECGWPHGGL
jgi:hypothetical protein